MFAVLLLRLRTHLAGVRNSFSLSLFGVGAELLPEVGHSKNTIGTFDNGVQRVFAVEISLNTQSAAVGRRRYSKHAR